jgi:adenylosuccinate lyase
MPAMMDKKELDERYSKILEVKFDLLSALDSRYLRYAKSLIAYVTPRAMHRYNLLVIRALTKTLMDFGNIPNKEGEEILVAAVPEKVSKERQWEWEKKLNHDVRGLVEAIGEHLDDGAKKYLYKGPTSYDILNTSYSLALRDAALEVIVPTSVKFMETMLNQAEEHKATVIPGRTHRQHAVPTTFGHYLMEAVQGFGEELKKFVEESQNLRGKLSGICGNRASYELLYGEDAQEIEVAALSEVGLEPDPLTGQVVHQHYYTNYFNALIQMGEYLAKFANDMRSFQQTEIGEVYEKKPGGDVGSSTAAQKVNPINSENIGGHQRQLRCRILPIYEDSQTDWERDLRNSSSMRYYMEILGMYMNEAERSAKIAANMWVRPEVMKKNLVITKGQIVKGLLQNAHEYAKNLARICQTQNKLFEEVVKADPIWQKLPNNIQRIIEDPASYIGSSVEDTEAMVFHWRSEIKMIKDNLKNHSELKYV